MFSPLALGLGSNLGDRRAHLAFAIDQLALHIQNLRVSSIIETAPFEVPGPQSPYLNAVAVGETALDPEALIERLMQIEQARGRLRPGPRAPRTLDLDLILFGSRVIDSLTLVVPHPRFRERMFVLEPLAELEPEWRDPVSGKTVRQLLERFRVQN